MTDKAAIDRLEIAAKGAIAMLKHQRRCLEAMEKERDNAVEWAEKNHAEMQVWKKDALDALSVLGALATPVKKLKHHLSDEGEYAIHRADGQSMGWEALEVENLFGPIDKALEAARKVIECENREDANG